MLDALQDAGRTPLGHPGVRVLLVTEVEAEAAAEAEAEAAEAAEALAALLAGRRGGGPRVERAVAGEAAVLDEMCAADVLVRPWHPLLTILRYLPPF